jgi:hypothetical protein
MTPNAIHQEHIATLHGTDTPITTRWSYQAHEPFALTVAFGTDRSRWVEWVFARDLLIDGLTHLAGEGDLSVQPGVADDTLALTVRSPSGTATFELDRVDTEAFLDATLALVPAGTESTYFDVDRLLAELSAG